MPPRIPPLFPPALQRRIARAAPRHLSNPPIARSIHRSSTLLVKSRSVARDDPPPPPSTPALSALLARLSLSPSPTLQDHLIRCLTHPSFNSPPSTASSSASTSSHPSTPDNALLATLGNSLLGLFASEHLAVLYPELPTEALKSAVTAYVGPKACVGVARELGVSVSGQRSRERDVTLESRANRRRSRIKGGGAADEGVLVRYYRSSGVDSAGAAGSEGPGKQRGEGFDEVVASIGIHSARIFVSSHFLSRHLDMTTLFAWKNPKHVLSSVIAKHLVGAGIAPGSPQTRVESRVIASTGVHSQAPLFNIGLFLPSGLKLAEGHGSSLKMAEHRAATNALHSLFLVRSDAGTALGRVPTSAHPAADSHGLGGEYQGLGEVVAESVVESSRGRVRR